MFFKVADKTPTCAVPLKSQRKTTLGRKVMRDWSNIPKSFPRAKVVPATSRESLNVDLDDDSMTEYRPHNYPDLLVSSEGKFFNKILLLYDLSYATLSGFNL